MKILNPKAGKKKHRKNYEKYTHKKCTICQKILPVSQFYKGKSKTKLGWSYRSHCINCARKYCKEYGANNKDKRNKRLKKWRRDNPEKARLLDKRRAYKNKYGITLKQLKKLKKHNNYKCWICNISDKRLVVDHDHKTGKVRGMLCDKCNKHLGYFENMDFKKIKQYLSEKCHGDILLEIANE